MRGYALIIRMQVGTIFGIMRLIIYNKNMQENQSFVNIIETLANALDERDKYTHGHSRRVTNLSLALGDKIGLQSNDFKLLRLGSILHDIGKIGVPDSILLKPGKLTNEEFEIIKNHPGQGGNILLPMKHDHKVWQLIPIVRHHHERYDGKGYPDGLMGKKIPLLARVVAVADSYDAMTSDRPYRKGMTKEKALNEIEKGTDTQYDPHLAMEFVSMMKQYGESECPCQLTCEIFNRIENNEISRAYKAQFCRGLHKSCARYKTRNKKIDLTI
jgi:HD-GYP domain-containing protein (c-di-GMP phosphodiesterase class II)